MLVTDLVADAVELYRSGRHNSAFLLALVAIEATACKRFGIKVASSERFRRFLTEEAQSNHMLRIRHGVDLPPRPEGTPPPPAHPPYPENPYDEAEWTRHLAESRKWIEDQQAWYEARAREWDDYRALFIDAGDDFRGGRAGTFLGKPRLVTTAGILYAARCELVHEGNLTAIRLVAYDDQSVLSVEGADPIRFSANYVMELLRLIVAARENRELFSDKSANDAETTTETGRA